MRQRKQFQVVIPIWHGIVEDVFLYEEEELARKKFKSLKKSFGIKPGDEGESENEVKWFETALRRR